MTKLIIKSGNTQPNVDNLDVNELGIYNKKLWSKTADEEVYAFGDDKVDKVEGKQLSTNDYTTQEKQKLASLSNYTLPTASTTILGGIKIGSDFSISSGVISLKNINFSKIINRPTTLAGYGITDALSDSDILQSITDDTGNNNLPVSQLAVKDYVTSKVSEAVRSNDAMVIKGTLGTGGDFTSLPTYGYVVGWSYKIITAGTYAGYTCEVGDLIYATNDGPLSGSSVINSDWSVIQSNIVGAISASTGLTANQLVVGNSYAVSSLAAGSNGQVLKIINGKPGWSTDNNDNTTYTFTSGNGGTFTVTPSNGSAQTISIGTPMKANALQVAAAVGSATQPVYFEASGVPKATNYTIQSNVPADAVFTDTTYTTFGRNIDGLVPHPTTTTSTRFLREDGNWVVPTDTRYTLATTSASGLLRQLDGDTTHFLRGDGTWQDVANKQDKFATVSINRHQQILDFQFDYYDDGIKFTFGSADITINNSGEFKFNNFQDIEADTQPGNANSILTKGYVDDFCTKYYTAKNTIMPTQPDGKSYWHIGVSTHQLTHYPIVQIFEVATGEMVLADVEVDSSYNVTISMANTTSTIESGTYRVVMVG